MLRKIAQLLTPPAPSGPSVPLRRFTAADRPIDAAAVERDGEAWRVAAGRAMTVHLYEIADPGVERCLLAYRARLRSENLAARGYLEMWCRFPGRGEYFSKGLQQPVSGTTGWASYETPFLLKAGQRPDLIKLNLALEGAGTVWISDIELLQTPLR
jgi:hypothetical protein